MELHSSRWRSSKNIVGAGVEFQRLVPGGNDARTFAKQSYLHVCVRQFTMNLRYAFNNCAFAHVRIEHSIGRITRSITRIKRVYMHRFSRKQAHLRVSFHLGFYYSFEIIT